MTIKYLGQYGTIDNISIFELLAQKGIEDTRPWIGKKTGKDWSFQFFGDEFGEGENVKVNLGKEINVPRLEVKKFTLRNICSEYQVEYPCELVAVYASPHQRAAGISVRRHNHDYFDGQIENIIELLRADGMEEPEAIKKLEAKCVTLDAFAITRDGEDWCTLANLQYIPGLGVNSDISEWYEIKVADVFQGRGIGSALERTMMGELKKDRQKLLVVNGVFLHAVEFYAKKGYGFYRFNARSAYDKPHLGMPGHIMARVLDENIIQAEINGHLDWSKDETQPRSLAGLKQSPFA